MIRASLKAFSALALCLGISGCARNAILEISMVLPDQGTTVTTATGSFVAMGALVAVRRDDPEDTTVHRYDDKTGRIQIDLADWSPTTRDVISVEASENLSDPIYVIVRLCSTVTSCDSSSAAFDATKMRDFVWKIYQPHHKARFTKITLPIPSGPSIDPDNTTGLTGIPASTYGCVLDDWAYVLSMAPPSGNARPTELNRCFVYSPDCHDGIAWGCDSNLVNGTSGSLQCDLEQATSKHFCE